MERTFQFVDNSATVNGATRKLMRSHVMKGKNAGKTLHRRSRLELGASRMTRCYFESLSEEEKATRRNLEISKPVERNLGNVLHTFNFPVELNQSSLKSIHQFFIFITENMYPSQLRLSSNKYKHDWLATTFVDEDASYCSLALMASTNEFFSGKGISSPQALAYHSNSLLLVKRRTEGENALSDSTLCMVMLLVLQEQVRHEETSPIHYEGLRRMIDLRGGLSQLQSCPTLFLKMSKMDILFALRYGKPIVFFRDRMSEIRSTMALVKSKSNTISTTAAHQNDRISPYIQDIIDDTMTVTIFFNSTSTGQTLDITTFLEILVSICCRLIQLHPLQNPTPECKKEAVYHIGLLTFMSTLFLQWDRRRIEGYKPLSQRLWEVLDKDLDMHDDDLSLWFLFIASMWFSVTSEHWLILRIKTLTMRLDITDWSRVRESLKKFPWIDALHDQPGRTIWDLVEHGVKDSKGC